MANLTFSFNAAPIQLAPPLFAADVPPNQGSATGSLCLQAANKNYYYVALGEANLIATGNLCIFQSQDGVNWQLVQNTGRGYSGGFQAIAVAQSTDGTTIYIAAALTSTGAIVILTYNTGSNTFSADTTSGPVYTQISTSGGHSIAVYPNDGSLLVAGYNSAGTAVQIARYASGSWSSAITVDNTVSSPGIAGLVAESSKAFLFYFPTQNFASNLDTLKCAPITNPTTVGSIVTVGTGIGNTQSQPSCAVNSGFPIYASSTTEILIPVQQLLNGNMAQYVYRSPVSALSFTQQLLDAGTSYTIGTAADGAVFGSTTCGMGIQSNTPYCFYMASLGADGNPATRSFIYYQTYSSGAWSGATGIYTSPTPLAPLALYPATLNAGGTGFTTAGAPFGMVILLINITALYGVDPFNKVAHAFFGGGVVSAGYNLYGPGAGTPLPGSGLIPSSVAVPISATSTFVLEKLTVGMRPVKHLPLRGAL